MSVSQPRNEWWDGLHRLRSQGLSIVELGQGILAFRRMDLEHIVSFVTVLSKMSPSSHLHPDSGPDAQSPRTSPPPQFGHSSLEPCLHLWLSSWDPSGLAEGGCRARAAPPAPD
jgi:hypothetical protein